MTDTQSPTAADPTIRSGYTVDIRFPSSFGAYQAPAHMAWATATLDRPMSPVDGPFTYCDLGCGNGMTLNVIATSYPEASFYGVDINPGHIAEGRSLAERGGLRNVTFVEASFADLQTQDLPQFDYITIAGIYSWLSGDMRAAITRFLESHLKPGGYVYIHFAALPGSMNSDALYTFIQAVAERVQGGSVPRFTKGVEVAQSLAGVGALFFRANPVAQRHLEHIVSVDKQGMAHEVLNSRIHSLYHFEVRRELAKAGLDFVGHANHERNYPELSMARELTPPLEAIAAEFGRDSALYETASDFVLQSSVRFEIYRKAGGEERAGFEAAEGLFLHRFTDGDEGIQRQKMTARTGIDFLTPPIGTVLKIVGRRSIAIRDVFGHPALEKFDRAAIRKAIEKIVATNLANVLLRPAPETVYEPGLSYRFISPLNAIALEEHVLSPDPIPFASPVIGTRLLLPRIDRVRLLAILGGNLGPVWKKFLDEKTKVTGPKGEPVTSFEDFRDTIQASLPDFAKQAIPELLRLGILEPVES